MSRSLSVSSVLPAPCCGAPPVDVVHGVNKSSATSVRLLASSNSYTSMPSFSGSAPTKSCGSPAARPTLCAGCRIALGSVWRHRGYVDLRGDRRRARQRVGLVQPRDHDAGISLARRIVEVEVVAHDVHAVRVGGDLGVVDIRQVLDLDAAEIVRAVDGEPAPVGRTQGIRESPRWKPRSAGSPRRRPRRSRPPRPKRRTGPNSDRRPPRDRTAYSNPRRPCRRRSPGNSTPAECRPCRTARCCC